jgi:lipoprotein-releasing system permease protein
VLFTAALVLATVTGLVAALAPALRAARLDPAVAIRG